MHKLPKDMKLDFFVGKTLYNIDIALNELIFCFDDPLTVTVSSSIGYVDSACKIDQTENFCEIIATLVKLLSQSVVSVKGGETGTLKLEFDKGGSLQLYDDSEQYESYVIYNGEQIIVV